MKNVNILFTKLYCDEGKHRFDTQINPVKSSSEKVYEGYTIIKETFLVERKRLKFCKTDTYEAGFSHKYKNEDVKLIWYKRTCDVRWL